MCLDLLHSNGMNEGTEHILLGRQNGKNHTNILCIPIFGNVRKANI